MNVTKVYANMLARLESNRLDGERLRRVVEAATVSEALKMLGDYGFALCDTIDGFIIAETDALIRFVNELAPTDGLRAALDAPFVYNNAKLAYKSRFVEIPEDSYYSLDMNVEAIKNGDYTECDRFLKRALAGLDECEKVRPQDIDIAITRAMYAYLLSVKDFTLHSYYRTEIDMKNLLTAARMRRLKYRGDEFIAGGRLKIKLLDAAVNAESFAEVFENTPYAQAAEDMQSNGFKELWRFERDTLDALYLVTDDVTASMVSSQPFFNYYVKRLSELKIIKTALVCVKTNSRELFYSRMPHLFD